MKVENALAELVQKIERQYYGKYRGIVVENNDPKKLGRLKVSVPSVFGSEVVTGWAAPCSPYGGDVNQGMLFIPEVGAGVWVEFEEGDLEFPIWVGTYWSQPESVETPTAFEADGSDTGEVGEPVVSRKIIKTRKGHAIQFNDKDGEESLVIVQRVDDSTHNHITLDANGITILSGAGLSITTNGDLTIDTSGNNFKVSAGDIELSASSIEMKKA